MILYAFTTTGNTVVINTNVAQADEPLPELPEQAQYLSHKNECFDWGTYGWVLQMLTPAQLAAYKHFVFLNSSIRGPFVPAYWPVRILPPPPPPPPTSPNPAEPPLRGLGRLRSIYASRHDCNASRRRFFFLYLLAGELLLAFRLACYMSAYPKSCFKQYLA